MDIIKPFDDVIFRKYSKIFPDKINQSSAMSYTIDESLLDFDSIYKPKTNRATLLRVVNKSIPDTILSDRNSFIITTNISSYEHPDESGIYGNDIQSGIFYDTFLYDVLGSFDCSYYKDNRNDINRGLYRNRALITPDIIFENVYGLEKATVINASLPKKSSRVNDKDNLFALDDRISFILQCIKYHKLSKLYDAYATLVLGDFNYSNFNQSIEDIAVILKYHLESEKIFDRCFERIIIAIEDNKCYDEFCKFWYNQSN